jgi:AraC-like DNA-binding protein
MLSHSQLLASTDPDEAFEFMRSRYPHLRRLSALPADGMYFSTRGLSIGSGYLAVASTSGYQAWGPTLDKLMVVVPRSGGLRLSTNPDVTFTRDAPVVLFPEDDFGSELGKGFVGLTYVLSRSKLVRLAEVSGIRLLEEVTLGGVPATEGVGVFSRLLVSHVELVSRIAPDRPDAQVRYHHINEALQLAFLDCLDQSPERSKPQSYYTERALSALRLSPVYRVGDLARAANCSVRTLQYALQRDLGMSAKDLIVEQRLKAARSALQARVAGQSITQIAAAAGFANASRFSAQYRNRFGELPSQTLTLVMPD